MQIFRARLASDIPDIFECGDNIVGVKRFAPTSLLFIATSHLQSPKGSGNRLAMNPRHKADVLNDFAARSFVIASPKPLAQVLPINPVFDGHIHMPPW